MLDYDEVYKSFRISELDWICYDGPRPRNDIDGFIISLAKWRYKRCVDKSTGIQHYDAGIKTCGLCMLHIKRDKSYEADCSFCPIFKDTGLHSCVGTPYYSASENDGELSDDRHLSYIDDEIEYLSNLFHKLYPDLPVPGEYYNA